MNIHYSFDEKELIDILAEHIVSRYSATPEAGFKWSVDATRTDREDRKLTVTVKAVQKCT